MEHEIFTAVFGGKTKKLLAVFFIALMMASALQLIAGESAAANGNYDYIEINQDDTKLAENSSWDPNTHTLVLSGVDIEYISYNSAEPLNIRVEGKNKICSEKQTIVHITTTADITIEGCGALDIEMSATSAGIIIDSNALSNDVPSATIKDIEVNIVAKEISDHNGGIYSATHNLFLKNVRLTVSDCITAVSSDETLTVEKSNLVAENPLLSYGGFFFLFGAKGLSLDAEPQGDFLYYDSMDMTEPVPWGTEGIIVVYSTGATAVFDSYEEQKDSNAVVIGIFVLVLTATIALAGYFAAKN